MNRTCQSLARQSSVKGNLIRLVVCVVLALGAGVFGVLSGGLEFGPGVMLANAEPNKKLSKEDRDRLLEKLHVVRSMKIAEALQLEEETQRALEAELKKYDVKLFEAELELRRSMRRLKKAIRRGHSDSDKLNALSDQVLEHRETIDRLRTERLRAAGRLVDGEDRARLLIFMPEFEKKVRRALRKARRGEGKGRGLEKPGERRERRKRKGKRRRDNAE